MVVPKIWDCGPRGGSVSGDGFRAPGACFHPMPLYASPALRESRLRIRLIESFQLSGLKSNSALHSGIDPMKVVPCA